MNDKMLEEVSNQRFGIKYLKKTYFYGKTRKPKKRQKIQRNMKFNLFCLKADVGMNLKAKELITFFFIKKRKLDL